MDYAQLGTTGLKVSRFCLGMDNFGDPALRKWAADYDAGRPLVADAVNAGINFFDTADAYSLGHSEVLTGRFVKEFFSTREEYVVATKVYNPMGEAPNQRGLSRRHILESVDKSLRRLDLDYIDVYFLHRWDYETPIAETMEALNDVVRAGKVCYIAASSMWAWQFAKAQAVAESNGWPRFVAMENHYNLLYREEEREMIPLLSDQGIGSVPYSPLARGLLARAGEGGDAGTLRSQTDGLIDERYPVVNHDVLRDLAHVASERGDTPAQVALSWLLSRPTVASAIIGVTKAKHLNEAISSLSLELSEIEIRHLEGSYRTQPVSGHY